MNTETKAFIGIVAASLVIVAGVLFFYSRNSTSTSEMVDQDSLVKSDSHQIAATSSKVTVVEFGDYECPACGGAHPIVKEVLAEFAGKITFAFRNFPLSMHQYAQISAEAAEAAGEQGKFWEMHDKLYENQDTWAATSTPLTYFITYAKELSLNIEQFKSAVESKKFQDRINEDVRDGMAAGVNATPTFFINGHKLLLNNRSDLENAITAALAE